MLYKVETHEELKSAVEQRKSRILIINETSNVGFNTWADFICYMADHHYRQTLNNLNDKSTWQYIGKWEANLQR